MNIQCFKLKNYIIFCFMNLFHIFFATISIDEYNRLAMCPALLYFPSAFLIHFIHSHFILKCFANMIHETNFLNIFLSSLINL